MKNRKFVFFVLAFIIIIMPYAAFAHSGDVSYDEEVYTGEVSYDEDDIEYWEEQTYHYSSDVDKLERELREAQDEIYWLELDLEDEIYKLENQLSSANRKADNYKSLYEEQQTTTLIVAGVAVVVIIGVVGWFKGKAR